MSQGSEMVGKSYDPSEEDYRERKSGKQEFGNGYI